MPRKRSSWGCVQRVSTDLYRIRYWADLGDGYSRRSLTFHGTRREADRKLAELRAEHEVEPGAPRRRASSMTVGEAWERFVVTELMDKLERGEIAKSTVYSRRACWKRNVEPRWASVRCDSVEPMDIQEWLLGMSGSIAKMSKTVLSQVMQKAVMYGICRTNPAEMKYRMPKDRRKADAGIYDLDGIAKVLAAVRDSPIEPAVILAALGSCRVGESLGVMCDEVVLSTVDGVDIATAPVRRQVDHNGKVLDYLKNEQSKRVVAIPGPPALRLARIASELSSSGLTWLCDDGTGAPVSQQQCNRMWKRLVSDAGVGVHPMKNLRNSWQTNAHWVLGMEPAIIEKMMGHSGKTVTAKHYDRPDAEMIVDAVAKSYKSHPYADTWDI